MDRLSRYTEIVPLPVLVAAPIIALVVFFLIPARWRLPLSLVVLVPWLTVGRLTDFPGGIQVFAKATGFVAYLGVGIAAFLDPGPNRRLPIPIWLYPLLACMGFAFVLTVDDRVFALVLRLQWLILVMSALLVARKIVDARTLHRVLIPLTIGCCIASLFPLAAIPLQGSKAFLAGLNRFVPWGANSNQIGVLFSLTFVFALYYSLQTRSMLFRLILWGFCGASAGMMLLSGSRSTMITMAFPSIPLMLTLSKKPVLTMIGGVIAAAGLYVVATTNEGGATERLGDLSTGRPTIWMYYLQEEILPRPLTGLLGTRGKSVLASEEFDLHPHNAYLEALYMGGFLYGGPMILLALYSFHAAGKVYLKRRFVAADTLLVAVLAFFMIIIYGHGFVNGAIYYPTYTWSWFHILLAAVLATWAADLKKGMMPLSTEAAYDEFSEYSDYGTDYGDDSRAAYAG